MAKAQQSHSVVLMDRSSTNKIGIKLLLDEEGALQYVVDEAPPLAPDVEASDLAYAEYQPDMELTWHQKTWTQGALKFYWERGEPGRYAIADKVWASTPNELSMGLMPKAIPFGIRNGAAELGATTGWSASGITLTAVTTAPYCGHYHFQGTAWSTNDYAEATVQQSEQPVARWQSQAVTVFARARGSVAGGTVRMQIVETGGSSTPTTSGTGVVMTTSYQVISATVTLQSDTTGITVRVEMSNDGGADKTIYFDLAQILPGSTIPNASHCQMKQMDTDLLCVTDRATWIFDETNDYWALQKVHGAAITGHEVYDDREFIGQGESTAYQYSDVDDASTTTASTLSGIGNNANRFAKAQNTAGLWALAKTLDDDNVYLATDPLNSTGSWGGTIEVGKDDHDILNLYQVDGTLGVGKEDGFYRYLSLDGNKFVNTYPGADHAVADDNFSRGIMYNGDFYTIVGEVGFVRYRGEYWEDLAPLIQSPGFSDFGNRVRAFGTDGRWLYVLVEDLNSDSITKASWLYMLLESTTGWQVHQVCSLTLSDALDMFTHKPSGGTNRFLFINGDINNEAASYRITIPNRTDTPRHATNADMALSGTFTTSYWDGNRPEVRKVFNRLTLLTENLSSTKTITVAYQVDDDTSFTAMNANSSVFSISPRTSLAFNENVVGTRIRFRFSFATTSTTDGPVLKAFTMEANWRPRRLRRWHMVGALESDMKSLSGIPFALPTKRLLARIQILRQEIAPIQLEDIDGNTHRCHITGKSERQFKVRAGFNGAGPRYSRAIELVLSEAFTISGEPWGTWRWNEGHWG
jgi:hypothetical protein